MRSSHKLLVLCGTIFLFICTESAAVNTFSGEDGRSYYYSAVSCDSLSPAISFFQKQRLSYTIREDKKCCYYKETRNSCCLLVTDGISECKCSPTVTCGEPSTVTTTTSTITPTTTSTTTSTTAPTTTSTTTSTTAPTTTSTTAPTTTSTTTSTTAPTTTSTTAPTTTTATSTTTTTSSTTLTTITTTTTKPRISLCSVNKRILNGAKLNDECTYKGLANITFGNFTACHAVLTTATVNGTYKTTFLTTSTCKSIIASNNMFDLQVGSVKLPLTNAVFNIFNESNDVAFLDLNDRFKYLLNFVSPCQTAACPFNQLSMFGLVDFNQCKIVSYGLNNSTSRTSNGLNEAAAYYSPRGCNTLVKTSNTNNSLCFTATSGLGLLCYGDTGAPVYCLAPSNQEWILVGLTQAASTCGTTPEFRVVPYPE